MEPDIVCVTETFLDASVGDVSLSGYDLISRRDRDDGRVCGGIAVFALKSISQNVIHIESCTDSERSWHIVHGQQCSFLLGLWYRPPEPGEIATIRSFDADLSRLAESCAFTVVVGDFNVHQKNWLRHSERNSQEGRELQDVASMHGLVQSVKEPTRENVLLDLVLSDCENLSSSVIPGFSDHKGTKSVIKFEVPEEEFIERECFNYTKTDWSKLQTDLSSVDWQQLLSGMSIDDAVDIFTRELLRYVRTHTPSRRVSTRK